MLLDCSGKTQQVSEEVLEAIIAGFEFACKAGPLCGEPVRHLKVNLVDFQLSTAKNLVLLRLCVEWARQFSVLS